MHALQPLSLRSLLSVRMRMTWCKTLQRLCFEHIIACGFLGHKGLMACLDPDSNDSWVITATLET